MTGIHHCRVATLAGKAGNAGKRVVFQKFDGKAGKVYIFYHKSWKSWIFLNDY